jgi:heme O synthase-like polyprenyltransferase
VAFLAQAYRLWGSVRRDGDGAAAEYSPRSLKFSMQLFHGSITYLAVIFLLVGLDPFVS